MRVLIQMGDSYPNESPCAKRMKTIHDVFKKNGHEVIVLAPKTGKDCSVYEDTIYCPTFPLKRKTTINRFLNQITLGITSFFNSRMVNNVDYVITTTPPPLINFFGYLIAKRKKAKLIYDVRDIWPDVAWEMGSFPRNSIYSLVFERIRDFMLNKADIIMTVSPGKVKKLKRYNKTANIIEIPNGLDEEFVKNTIDESIVKKYGFGKQFSVCYIGNLGLAQGLKQLLDLAKKSKRNKLKAHFYIFGSGVDENNLKEYSEKNQLDNVSFPGRIPNKSMYTVLKKCDMSFISLVNENLTDSVPTKLFESLGCGCPVMLAACGDSELILKESGLGFSVKPNDNEKLWDVFLNMYKNIDCFEDKKDFAVKYVLNNYSRQKIAQKLEKELLTISED